MRDGTTRLLVKVEARCADCKWRGRRGYEARRHAGAEGHTVKETRSYAIAPRTP